MRILHMCLAAFYIDKYSYQENILPRMHKKQGHEVQIIASVETFVDDVNLGYIEPAEYLNEDGIKVTRLPYAGWIPHKLATKLRVYPGVYQYLKQYKPELIWLHDVQFLSIYQVVKYAKRNKVRIIADGHTDFGNSAKTCLSKLLHKYVYAPFIKHAEPYIEHFFGTLPSRVDFFKKVYSLPDEKVSFLPMGVDDELIKKYINNQTRKEIRNRIGVTDEDTLLIVGGKLDVNKENILDILEIVGESERSDLKIVFFGSVCKVYQERFNRVCQSDRVINVGWLAPKDFYQHIVACDLAVFPGSHSVLWEEVVGIGIPCLFRDVTGAHHVDVNGNCRFIKSTTKENLKQLIFEIIEPDILVDMKDKANKAKDEFRYSDIAKRAIQ